MNNVFDLSSTYHQQASTIQNLLIVFPDPIGQIVVVEEEGAGVVVTVKAVAVELAIGSRHCAQLLNLGGSLLRVKALELGYLLLITIHAKLILVVHVVVEAVSTVRHWVLFVILVHDFQVDIVVDLESTHFDLVFPDLIMQLHIIQYRIHEPLNIRILITQ